MIRRASSATMNKIVDDMLRLAGKLLAQLRILRGDADRAGVQMTLPHHDAAERDQRRGREAELFGTQQGGDHDVATGLQATIGLQAPRGCAGHSAPASDAFRRCPVPTADRHA